MFHVKQFEKCSTWNKMKTFHVKHYLQVKNVIENFVTDAKKLLKKSR